MTLPTTTTSATSSTQDSKKDHIVIFPFLAKGHTIPLLHLSALLSARGLRITLITTHGNAPFLRSFLPLHRHPDVHLLLLPFPSVPSLPSGVESTDQLPSLDLYPHFLGATTLLKDPFHRALLHLLNSSSPPPLCLISDFFFGWTFPLCCRLGLPRIVFHGMSAFSMTICKSIWLHLPNLPVNSDTPFHVPGTPSTLLLSRHEIPDTVLNSADPLDPATQFLSDLGDSDIKSWGVLVNSFSDVDRDYVGLFENFYENGARAWVVGPLSESTSSLIIGESNYVSELGEVDECIRWLNQRKPGSVVYVSFGTQTEVPDEQLDEVGHGLAETGFWFLWAVRSDTWTPPEGVEKMGKIVKWAPQREALQHAATGGCISHCGWNSVLEAVSAATPILAWPMIAEQQLNAKMVVEELGVGLRVREVGGSGLVRRGEVREGVRELMSGEKGRMAGEKVVELSRKAKSAVAEGGSSCRSLDELIEELKKNQEERNGGDVIWSEDGGEELFELRDGIEIA